MNLLFYFLHLRRNISRWNQTFFTKMVERLRNKDVLNNDDFRERKSNDSQIEHEQCVRIYMHTLKRYHPVIFHVCRGTLSPSCVTFAASHSSRHSCSLFFRAQLCGLTDCHSVMELEWGHQRAAVRGPYLSFTLQTSDDRGEKWLYRTVKLDKRRNSE